MQQQRLAEIIDSAVSSLNFELWGWEFSQQQSRALLCVYIESSNGVSADDCAKVSRQIGSLLDVEDLLTMPYALEVSSPGMERSLYTFAQYQGYVGHKIKLRLHRPMNGQRNFVGTLQHVDTEGQSVCLMQEGADLTLQFADIEKARLVADF